MGNEVPLTSVGAKMANTNSVGEDKPFTTRIIDNMSPIDDRMADERITDHIGHKHLPDFQDDQVK